MVVEAARVTDARGSALRAASIRQDIRATIREYVDGGIGNGLSLQAASEHALELLIGDGLAGDVLRAIGASAIAEIWSKQQRDMRKRAEEGRRRVDLDELKDGESLLESLFPAGDGRWLPLGDFSSGDCRQAAVAYGKQERTTGRKKRAFLSLEEALKPGQTVRQCYTDDQLRALFTEGAD